MKKLNLSGKTGIFTAAIISILLVVIGAFIFKTEPVKTSDSELETATVTSVIAETTQNGINGNEVITVIFEAKITSGSEKGNSFKMTQTLDDMTPPVPKKVQSGDKILVGRTNTDQPLSTVSEWAYAGVNNLVPVIILILFFLLLILLIGGFKGVTTILALVITVAAIFFIYIPSVLQGYNIYASTIIISLFIILSSLIILNGFNKKTLCAIVGNAGGLLISGLLALLINEIFGITGIVDQDYLFLTMLEGGVSIDLKALIWGGMLIGSLGAVMDVSMSLASPMQELYLEMENPTFARLVRSGFNIGKDSIGTMANTLILAYVGSSFATILLFAAYNSSLIILLNFEMILVEIIQAVVGSIGILLSVPITVFFSAFIQMRSGAKKDKLQQN
ncbi:MAG: YibE/F family protein [Oscillospiraceae bacterium]|nr:YibE/F family protein [Oscillospiraceae bacterium]